MKQEILSKTNAGLDIILDLLPQAMPCVDNPKLKFKKRQSERTASAQLLPPTGERDYWAVIDYGESNRLKSPFDLYMEEYNISSFAEALHSIAQRYGIVNNLNTKDNHALFTKRERREDEEVGINVVTRDGFTQKEQRLWGPNVTAEHLTQLGWEAVERIEYVKENGVTEVHSGDNYPIFVETCRYIDDKGIQQVFKKIYQPYNPDKSHRFVFVGKQPKNYVHGMDLLKKKYAENGDEKLSCVMPVSGGSDAANCLSMGYLPVWLNSESVDWTAEQINMLGKYAYNICHVADCDATGERKARQLLLKYPWVKQVKLPKELLSKYKDRRGNRRKDLKDYVELRPEKEAFSKLVSSALSSKFVKWEEDDKGKGHYVFSRAPFAQFLELNGYYALKDDTTDNIHYINVVDNIVRDVKPKDISQFVINWCDSNGANEKMRNCIMRKGNLPTDKDALLHELNPDFRSYTEFSQNFYFRNGWVKVTANSIVKYKYSDCEEDKYIWQDSIMQHDYVEMSDMFRIERMEDGSYGIELLCDDSEFFQFLMLASNHYWREEQEYKKTLTEEQQRDNRMSLINKIFVIGYMLHRYKSESMQWAPFVTDAKLGSDEDECNGRSGKSFFLKTIAKLIRNFSIDGKRFDVKNRFTFDGVTEHTEGIFIDECKRDFPFEHFFGMISSGIDGEAKNGHPFKLDYQHSPKMMFGSNFVVKANDPSTKARLLYSVFSDYFHEATAENGYRESRSIRDYFGHNLLDGTYPEDKWSCDIAFIMQCERAYLSLIVNNEKILPPMHFIEKRRINEALGIDFVTWATDFFSSESNNLDRQLLYQEVYNDYAEAVGNAKKKEPQQFTKDLIKFISDAAHLDCYNPKDVTGSKKDGERWRKTIQGIKVMFMYVRSKAESERLKQECEAKNAEQTLFDETPF